MLWSPSWPSFMPGVKGRVGSSHRQKGRRIWGWLGCKRETERRQGSFHPNSEMLSRERKGWVGCMWAGAQSQDIWEKLKGGRFQYVLEKTPLLLPPLCPKDGSSHFSALLWDIKILGELVYVKPGFSTWFHASQNSINSEARMCYFRPWTLEFEAQL